MSDVNKNYLNGRIEALETTVAFLESEVTKWKEAYDDAHEALQGDWLESKCPVCGSRFGDHKPVPGWMGNGCPTPSGGNEHE